MSGRSLFPPDPVDAIRAGRREGIRHVLDGGGWQRLTADLGARPATVPLIALWAEANGQGGGQVHALFHPDRARPLIATVSVEAGRYLGLSGPLPAAAPYERIVRDLWGFEAMHARDLRPLLDHGAWPATAPLSARPGPPARGPEPPDWRPVADESWALLEEGPVGMAEGLLRTRLALDGPQIRAAEFAHGFNHRGLLASLTGCDVAAAAAIVERVAAVSTVAHATAFARAVEHASGTELPPDAAVLREVAGEAERIAAFLATLGDMAAAAGAARLGRGAFELLASWREVMHTAFGHRFARGAVRPGAAMASGPVASLGPAVEAVAAILPKIERGYARRLAPLLRGRAVVSTVPAGIGGASGIVGRASGQGFDARRASPVPVAARGQVEEGGCADTRMRLRLAGVADAAARIAALLRALPDARRSPVTPGRERGEGLGVAEAPEGEVWHFVRLDGEGRIAAAYGRDPSIGHAALAEAALAGEAAENATLLRLSFGLSPEGIDL